MPRKPREEVILSQISELETELREVRRNEKWTCPSCAKKVRARDIDLIKSFYYVSPYSCTNGDFWTFGHWEIICPKCGKDHRMYPKTEHQGARAYPAPAGDLTPAALLQWINDRRPLFKTITERRNNK